MRIHGRYRTFPHNKVVYKAGAPHPVRVMKVSEVPNDAYFLIRPLEDMPEIAIYKDQEGRCKRLYDGVNCDKSLAGEEMQNRSVRVVTPEVARVNVRITKGVHV